MAIVNISDISNLKTVSDIKPSSTVQDIQHSSTINNISLGLLSSAVAIYPSIVISDIKPDISNIQSVNYSKIVTASSILPFRLTINNIGIEGYSPQNPPGIGVQVIGFSNYIL
jgi:hypothetical protein